MIGATHHVVRTPGGGARATNPPDLRELLVEYAGLRGWPRAGDIATESGWRAFAADAPLDRVGGALLWLDDLEPR